MDDRNRLAISTLNSLIQTCDDGSQGFLMAADAVQDAALKELFRTYGRERDEFAEELRGEVRRLGGTPELDGSVARHRSPRLDQHQDGDCGEERLGNHR
jgi:uncharacterized protein (TIGR02284 family)